MPPLDPPLSIDEVEQFTKATWKTQRCERCESGNWMFDPDRCGHLAGLAMAGSDGAFGFGSSSALGLSYVLVCTGCGSVRLTSAYFVDGWVNKHLRGGSP